MNATHNQKELITLDALRVTAQPATLQGNFAELEGWLDTLLADKVTVVTETSLAAEKKAVAELRKLAKALGEKSREVIALVSGDIDCFKARMRNLQDKVLAVADEKALQVKLLEDDTRTSITELLKRELDVQWALLKVGDEFRKADISALVKLTAMTEAGNLSKSALMAVKDKATADYQLQVKTGSRLMELENLCLKQGINPPLNRVSVESFLFEVDDGAYYAKLDALIGNELERVKEAERRLLDRLEKEKQREEMQAQPASIAPANPPTVQPEPATTVKNTAVQAPADAVTYSVTALVGFEFQSKPNASLDKIKAHFTQQFEAEGKKVLSLQVKAKAEKELPDVAA